MDIALCIPIVGWIFMIIWFSQKGSTDENRFGPEVTTVDNVDPAD